MCFDSLFGFLLPQLSFFQNYFASHEKWHAANQLKVFVLTMSDELQKFIDSGDIRKSRHFQGEKFEGKEITLESATEHIKNLFIETANSSIVSEEKKLDKASAFYIVDCRDAEAVQDTIKNIWRRYQQVASNPVPAPEATTNK